MTKPTLKSELSQLFFTTIEMDSIPFYKIIAVVLSFLLLGSWKWEIVGIGTLFARWMSPKRESSPMISTWVNP